MTVDTLKKILSDAEQAHLVKDNAIGARESDIKRMERQIDRVRGEIAGLTEERTRLEGQVVTLRQIITADEAEAKAAQATTPEGAAPSASAQGAVSEQPPFGMTKEQKKAWWKARRAATHTAAANGATAAPETEPAPTQPA